MGAVDKHTVTLGSAAVLTKSQATRVARIVIAYAQVGQDPATDRKRIRSAPRFDDFLAEYWSRWSPRWKLSTYETNAMYRAHYLEGSFPGIFIDALNEADVTKWFADLNNRTGPGAANRVLSILNHMLNKAETWGYRLENTNPCRVVRLNKRRQCERFLTVPELTLLGTILAAERAGTDKVRSIAATAITLLLLTGCRSSEVMSLQWGDSLKGTLEGTATDTQRREALIWAYRVWRDTGGKAVEDALRVANLFVHTRRPNDCIGTGKEMVGIFLTVCTIGRLPSPVHR